jgi:hypothetical protein
VVVFVQVGNSYGAQSLWIVESCSLKMAQFFEGNRQLLVREHLFASANAIANQRSFNILLPDFSSEAVVGRYENQNYLSVSDKPKDRIKMESS